MASDELTEFLKYTNSQQEASLILAKDDEEQNNFLTILKEQQFEQITTLAGLLTAIKTPSKVFYVISDDLPQGVYDFISQYPTGHLSIFDKTVGNFQAITPPYTDVAVIFMITKERMTQLVKNEAPLLDKVGLVFQN